MRAVVIGSGPGGAAIAGLLARRGFRVTLLEKNTFIGGRCASLERDGFRYDIGVHMFARGEAGPHGVISRILGSDLTWILKNPPAVFITKNKQFELPRDLKPILNTFYFARKIGVKMTALKGALRVFGSLINGYNKLKFRHATVKEFLSEYTQDKSLHLFINCFSMLFFALPYDRASALEFIECFSNMFNDISYGYVRGGAGRIPESFVEAMKRYGGEIKLGEPVIQIDVGENGVRGVETETDYYQADIVISGIGIKYTLELAGKENFPPEYVEKVESLKYSDIYNSIRYALDEEVVPHPCVINFPDVEPDEAFAYLRGGKIPEDLYFFMPVPTNHDPYLAPEGKQLVIAGTPVPGNERDRTVLKALHNRVCELFPKLEDKLIWHEKTTSGVLRNYTGHSEADAIGLAQTPDQVDKLRPSPVTPIKNLYLVGADVGRYGIGTELASGSALDLIRIIETRT